MEFVNETVKSPDDERDWVAESIYPEKDELKLPKTLDLRPNMTTPRNQGSRGTCAAFTAAAMKEWQERKDVGYEKYLSPEFIYFHRKTKPNAGMYGRNVMEILKNYGCPIEFELPYQKSDVQEISKEVYEKALNFKIKSYASVKTIDGLKTALYKNGPCYISFPTYKNRPEFWRAEPGESRRGGHAVLVVGYNKTGFIIRNSWGENWNGDGHVIYPYSEWGVHWEVWTTIDEKSSVPDEPSDLKKCLRAECQIM